MRLFLSGLLLLGLVACSKPMTTEQRIIAVIREMETRIEEGERRPFMSHVAEGFQGQDGTLDRQKLNAFVLYQLNRYQRLQAQLFPIHVTETGEGTARARLKALVTGGANLLPESGQLYQFDTYWKEVDGEWLLVRAEWEPVYLDEVL